MDREVRKFESKVERRNLSNLTLKEVDKNQIVTSEKRKDLYSPSEI